MFETVLWFSYKHLFTSSDKSVDDMLSWDTVTESGQKCKSDIFPFLPVLNNKTILHLLKEDVFIFINTKCNCNSFKSLQIIL